jgi:hypothetical protein
VDDQPDSGQVNLVNTVKGGVQNLSQLVAAFGDLSTAVANNTATGITSISGGTTGLTATVASRVATLAGVLSLANGGTDGLLDVAHGGTGVTSIAAITAELNLFTSTLRGLVPPSGGGTANFLRADGNWVAPTGIALAGGLGVTVTNNIGTPNTKADITVSSAILTTTGGAGVPFQAGSGTFTADLTINGANGLDTGSRSASTWYHQYLISNGSTVASLASLSPTSPTLPGGFTFFWRAGAMQTDGSSNLFRTLQKGREARYVITASTNTASFPFSFNGTTGGGYSNVAVLGNNLAAPPTATKLAMQLYRGNVTNSNVIAAPNTSYSPSFTVSNPQGFGTYENAAGVQPQFISELLLESVNVAILNDNTANRVSFIGWSDAVNAI